MHEDFGTLVDYLRGELDEPAMAAVRARLENDAAFFDAFNRLRRTFAVLRSLPRVNAQGAAALPALPHFEPAAAFVADLRREFEARGWVALLPELPLTPAYVAALRVEFAVRALLACVPLLEPGAALLRDLRARFAVRGVIGSLPLVKARAEWVRALRCEFVVRATVDCLPQIAVRPEFAARLRAGFAVHALADAVPRLEVSDRFRRRLQVALFEQQRAEPAPEPARAPMLPAVTAGDSFRRRLFKRVLLSSRPQLGREPMKIDAREYQFGRVLSRAFKRGKRSIAATFAMHALAVVLLFFVWNRLDPIVPQTVTALASDAGVTPELPGEGSLPRYEPAPRGPLPYTLPAGGRLTPELDEYGLGGDGAPRPDVPAIEPAPAPPERHRTETLADSREVLRGDSAAWFRLRSASQREKIAYLGSSELYDALASALSYLQRMQEPDGNWGFADMPAHMQVRDADRRTLAHLELTSAALLAYLGDGHSSRGSLVGYDYNVKRGVDWILRQQKPGGRIGPDGIQVVLGHAMATLVLAEDFALSRDQRLRKPLRDACRWLAGVRLPDGSGGMPYLVNGDACMMTAVWAHMALATARNLRVPELDAPQSRLDELLAWFERETRGFTTIRASAEVLAQTELLPVSGAASMTLFAVDAGYEMRRATFLSRLGREMPALEVHERNDRVDNGDVRYLFFGSLAFALEQQRTGQTAPWQSEFARTVLANQVKTGGHSGSFEPASQYARVYGRVFSTAFAALSIENAYRVQLLRR
ncbi:MAG: terpene cyclase/mutase family protein [Planctomycetes bacterium]|nr:terpene cyclase/mutase family protein [Planctomycetota bacterium]